MAQHNADQITNWKGQSGERWVVHQARLDARLEVFGQAAITAIDDAVKMTFEVGPLSRALVDQPDDIRARASAAVRAAFADCPGERSVMIDGATWIVTARNPAQADSD